MSEREAATERAHDNNLKNAIDCLNVVGKVPAIILPHKMPQHFI